jgi:hypothetical protein
MPRPARMGASNWVINSQILRRRTLQFIVRQWTDGAARFGFVILKPESANGPTNLNESDTARIIFRPLATHNRAATIFATKITTLFGRAQPIWIALASSAFAFHSRLSSSSLDFE